MTTIREARLARSLDTMIDVTNSDPGHIARAKEKAKHIKEEIHNAMMREVKQAIAEENARNAEAKAKENADKKARAKERATATKIGLATVTFVIGAIVGQIYGMLMF